VNWLLGYRLTLMDYPDAILFIVLDRAFTQVLPLRGARSRAAPTSRMVHDPEAGHAENDSAAKD
jgi:hypothetical protein